MRWFFLLCLVLAAFAVNVPAFERLSASRALNLISLNLVLLALAGIWWSAYVFDGHRRATGLHYAIAVLLLGCGIALSQYALELLLAQECPSTGGSGRSRPLSSLINALVEAGHCQAVLSAHLAIGVSLLLGSAHTCHQARRGA